MSRVLTMLQQQEGSSGQAGNPENSNLKLPIEKLADPATVKATLDPRHADVILNGLKPPEPGLRRNRDWPTPTTLYLELPTPVPIRRKDKEEDEHGPALVEGILLEPGTGPRTLHMIITRLGHADMESMTYDRVTGKATLHHDETAADSPEANAHAEAAAGTAGRLMEYLGNPGVQLTPTDQEGWYDISVPPEVIGRLARLETANHPGGTRVPPQPHREAVELDKDPNELIRKCRLMRWIQDHPAYRDADMTEQVKARQFLSEIIMDRRTQRILIDHQQMDILMASDHQVPDEIVHELRWPFDASIYIEPTRPMPLSPEDAPDLLLQGITVTGSTDTREVTFAITYRNSLEGHTFVIETSKGTAGGLTHWGLESKPETGELISRMLAYMTARGIEIVEAPLSRNERRLMARKKIPNPWHIIQVTPTIRHQGDPQGDRNGSGQGYRYDVIGHLRYGRHRLADGSYRMTKEWVKPHQRGLQHERYIPATRYYRKGEPSPGRRWGRSR